MPAKKIGNKSILQQMLFQIASMEQMSAVTYSA